MNGHFLCLKSVLRMTLVEPKLFASLFCNCFDIPKRLSFKTSFQRQRRNVPVYLHDEMKLKDKEESQLLMQFQHLKDMERQLKDEETRKGQRFDRAKMDAFNLGVSEAVKAKRLERPKTSDIPVSFCLYFIFSFEFNP